MLNSTRKGIKRKVGMERYFAITSTFWRCRQTHFIIDKCLTQLLQDLKFQFCLKNQGSCRVTTNGDCFLIHKPILKYFYRNMNFTLLLMESIHVCSKLLFNHRNKYTHAVQNIRCTSF